MSTTTTTATTTTINGSFYRVSDHRSVVATCETESDKEGIITYRVDFVMLAPCGDRAAIGYSFFLRFARSPDVLNLDSEQFPDLDVAIRIHAERILEGFKRRKGLWLFRPDPAGGFVAKATAR